MDLAESCSSLKVFLKGTVALDFYGAFWLEWIYLGLKGNRFWFLNFKKGSSILDSYFKY